MMPGLADDQTRGRIIAHFTTGPLRDRSVRNCDDSRRIVTEREQSLG